MGLRKKKSLIDQANETVNGYVEQVRPQLEAAVATAMEKAAPVIADARTKAAPVIADAKAKAAPVIADARAKAAPAVATGAALAAEKIAAGATIAAEKAAAGATMAAEKVAEVAEPQPTRKKGSTFRKLLLVTGLAAAAAFVVRKLQSGKQSDTWQSSYTPTPAPSPAAAPGGTTDEGGSSPDEVLADTVEAPHPVTTPDDPADVVDVDKER
jgi:hypothetical protein